MSRSSSRTWRELALHQDKSLGYQADVGRLVQQCAQCNGYMGMVVNHGNVDHDGDPFLTLLPDVPWLTAKGNRVMRET